MKAVRYSVHLELQEQLSHHSQQLPAVIHVVSWSQKDNLEAKRKGINTVGIQSHKIQLVLTVWQLYVTMLLIVQPPHLQVPRS